MKVLFIASGNNQYGISPIIKNQAVSLINAGIHVDYFPITGKGVKGYIKNVRPLRNFLKSNKYQIIHAHYGFCGLVALLAKTNEKVVISYMGSDILFFGNDTLSHKLVFYTEVILNRVLAMFFYDFIIIKSQEMSKKIYARRRKAILPNGVNLVDFEPVSSELALTKLNLKADAIILFSSDPARTEKNFSLAKKAIDIINNENLKVICLHGIDQKILKYYYSAASVLLMTSFHEGSPNVVKEAMACNCPIVSTDVGDVRLLIDGVNGCYISSYDPYDVADKLSKAIAFKERTAGRQKILDLGLDQNIVSKKLIDIYYKLLKK